MNQAYGAMIMVFGIILAGNSKGNPLLIFIGIMAAGLGAGMAVAPMSS